MRKIVTLSLLLSLSPAYADGLLPPKETPVIQGQIEKAPEPIMAQEKLTEDQASDLISVQYDPLTLASQLKKRFSAYKITVKSNYPGKLQLNMGTVSNGISGQMAANQMEKDGMTYYAVGGLTGLLIARNKNKKAENEASSYSGQVPPVENLHKGESFEFTSLVPAGQRPQSQFVFRDRAQGLDFTKYAR